MGGAEFLAGLIAFALLPGAAVAAWATLTWRERQTPKVAILGYHRVVEGLQPRVRDNDPAWTVTAAELDDQLHALLSAGWVPVSLDALVAAKGGRGELPSRGFLLTFDDGYSSFWDLARPILDRHGVRATVFCVLDPDDHSRELIAGVDNFLSAEQIRELANQGHTIGSHTVTHCILSQLSAANALAELTESKRRLAEIIGRPVHHFCVPRAGGNRLVQQLVAQAGYQTSTGMNRGTAKRSSDLLQLPRITVPRGLAGRALVGRLRPERAAFELLLASAKRLPQHILGPNGAYKLRNILYFSPLGRVLGPRAIAATALTAVGLYALASALWWWHA